MADESLPSDQHSEPAHSGHSEYDHSAQPHHDDPAPASSDPTAEVNQPARYIQPSHSTEPVVEEDEEGGPVKTFLEHLEDLRWVLIKIIASVLVSMTVCLVASPQIVEFLKLPLIRSNAKVKLEI